MLVGGIGELVAIFMISLCKEYYQFFLAQGALLGSSMSFLVLPSLSTVSRHFIKHRGIAVGLSISGSSIGGVIWPIMINKLLNSDGVSFAWTIRIVGFAMMPLMAIACLTVRSPAVKHSDDEEGAAGKHGEKKDVKAGLAVLKNAKFLTYCLGSFIFFFGLFSPLFYLTSYATSLHKSPSFAFYLISTLNGASFFGRVLPGILGDRFGHFNLLSMGAVSCSIIAFCWTAADSTGGLVVFAIAYGFASGVSPFRRVLNVRPSADKTQSIMSTQAACAAHLATKETLGTAQGLVLAAGSFT
jgi:MFS family permease